MFIPENGQLLKYVSLVTLTLQNALVGLSMRYARTRSGDMFLSSTGKSVLIARWPYLKGLNENNIKILNRYSRCNVRSCQTVDLPSSSIYR